MPRCDGAHQGQPAALAWFHMPRWWEREGLDVGRPPATFHVSSSHNLPGYSVLCYSMRGLDIWGLWEGFLMRSDLGLLPGSEIWRGSDFCVVSANLGSRLTLSSEHLACLFFCSLSHLCGTSPGKTSMPELYMRGFEHPFSVSPAAGTQVSSAAMLTL